jgi:hypothetical protein
VVLYFRAENPHIFKILGRFRIRSGVFFLEGSRRLLKDRLCVQWRVLLPESQWRSDIYGVKLYRDYGGHLHRLRDIYI